MRLTMLGSCLIQNKTPIAFHSRQLSETETKYSPIELELHGIVEACRKYHYYIYGKKVITIITDHKTLVSLVKSPISKITSHRLLRLRTKLLPYNLKVEYTPGKLMFLADTLSRAPLYSAVGSEIKFDKMVHNLSVEALDEPKSIEKLRCATARDPVLCKVLEYNRSG